MKNRQQLLQHVKNFFENNTFGYQNYFCIIDSGKSKNYHKLSFASIPRYQRRTAIEAKISQLFSNKQLFVSVFAGAC